MVEKGQDVEIDIDWYAGDKSTQSTATPTSKTKYTIKSDNVTFETVSEEQKAADAAKAVVLTQGGNKQGLQIVSKTAKAGSTAVVNMTLGGAVQMGALTEKDGNRADEINGLFGNADWLANNASDYAKTQGYFVMTLDVPVPDGYTENYASVQTNKALYDFYMDGKTPPDNFTSKTDKTTGKTVGIKTSTDSDKNGFEPLVGDGNRKVLPFAFIAIKGEPVTLEFTFKNSNNAEKKVKYIIDTTGVTVEGTEVGGDVDEQPKVIGAESAEGLPTPKVEQVEGKSETTITYEATDKEVTGGTEKADTTSFAAMFGADAQEAIGASYEGQQLVLTTIDVPVSHLGDISTYSLRTGTTVTMKQTNAALADIAQYLSEETITNNVWTKQLTTDGDTLKVPVLVKPGSDVTLEFSTGTGESAKSSTYTIKMPSVSVVAPRGDAAVPKGEIIKGLNVGLEKGKDDNKYTLKVSSEDIIKAGKLSAKDHGVTAEVAEDYNNAFAGYDPFKDFFDRDYTQKDKDADGKEITYSSGLNELVRSATMLQFTIPVPAGATKATIKQISPLMEAYQKDPIHEKASDGTWYKETTKTSGLSGSFNLAILASPQWETGDSVIEVTFIVDGKEQKVTYTVDTEGLKTEKYTPVQTPTQPVTPETSKTQTPATPNTPSSEQPSAPSNTVVPPVEEEPKEPEENVTPPEDGENKEENTTPPEDGENKEENTTPPEGEENKEENTTPPEGGENKEENTETDTEKDTDNEQEKTQAMPSNTQAPGAE